MRCEPRVFLVVILSAPHEAPAWLQHMHTCSIGYRVHCVCPMDDQLRALRCLPRLHPSPFML